MYSLVEQRTKPTWLCGTFGLVEAAAPVRKAEQIKVAFVTGKLAGIVRAVAAALHTVGTWGKRFCHERPPEFVFFVIIIRYK